MGGWADYTGVAAGGWLSPHSANELAFVDAPKSLAGEAWEASCEGEGSCETILSNPHFLPLSPELGSKERGLGCLLWQLWAQTQVQ